MINFISPLLITLYSVAFTYYSAIGELRVTDFFLTIAIFLPLSLFLFQIFNFIFNSKIKASFYTSIFFIVFWNVTPFSRFFYNVDFCGIKLFRLRFLIPISLFFLLFLFFKVLRSKSNFLPIINFIFFSYLALNIFCFTMIVKQKIEVARLISSWDQKSELFRSSRKRLPDIYFIILDTYLSKQALVENFHFSNDSFLSSLKKRGFCIFNSSISNYPETVSSTSCTMNMQYHKKVNSDDIQEFFGLGFYKNENNYVSNFLKSNRYKIINIPSVWGHVPRNNFADVDYSCFFPKRFIANLLERMSIISPLVYLYIGYDSAAVFFEQLRLIEHHINDESPKFVFAHILKPHSPFVFSSSGTMTTPSKWLDDNELYIGQLRFINKKIIELVDKILDCGDRERVIILQGDHGLNGGIIFSDYSKINEVDRTKLIKGFGILNAIYLQNVDDDKILYEEVSPVNNFRVLFNTYFGTNFKILKDESFVGPDKNGEFVKVEILKENH